MTRYSMICLALGAVLGITGSLGASAADRPDTVRTVFVVEGMHCDGCSSTIRGTLERMDGVIEASADHEKGSAEVLYYPNKVKPEQLEEAIEKLGYTVTAASTAAAEEDAARTHGGVAATSSGQFPAWTVTTGAV